ncbi:MAG: MFS transporter [Dehalococcoidia bacterium]|jgi:MFS family permease|nr:MFS transporter [Dehalococcoidia bacterium]
MRNLALWFDKKFGLEEHSIAHYAWVIVAIAGVVQMVGAAIRMAFGVLVDPLVETFGWSPGSVGLAYALMSIVTALASPLAGYLGNRFGARLTMSVGTVLFLIGMLWTAQTSEIWELYVAYGLIFGISQALLLIPVVPAVAAWFRRHLGLGTGIMMVSWSLGPAIVVQALAVLFNTVGWSQAFTIVGVTGTAILIFVLLFFRNTPEEADRVAYGTRPGEKPLITSGNVFITTQREFQGFVYRTNAFWNLINVHFLGCVGHAVILVGIIPMGISRGLGPLTAAGVLTTISVVSVGSRFLTPVLSDRFGSKAVMFGSFFGQGIGVLLLFTASSTWEFYLFAVLWAIPYGGEGTSFPVINRQYYGHLPMGTTYGWQILGAGLGMALGGYLPGLVFDITGGYSWAIGLSAGFSLAGAVAIVLLETTRRQLIPDWPELVGEQSAREPAGRIGAIEPAGSAGANPSTPGSD